MRILRVDSLGDRGAEGTPPDGAVELGLAAIWAEVLDLPAVSRDDDFFALGGDSLGAARAAVMVEDAFGVPLPLSALLDAPTVASMAGRLDQGRVGTRCVRLGPDGPGSPVFWMHSMHGATFYAAELARRLGGRHPVVGVEAQRFGEPFVAPASLRAAAATYAADIMAEHPQDSYVVGGYSYGGSLAYEVAHHLQDAGKQIERLVLLDPPAPFPAVGRPYWFQARLYERLTFTIRRGRTAWAILRGRYRVGDEEPAPTHMAAVGGSGANATGRRRTIGPSLLLVSSGWGQARFRLGMTREHVWRTVLDRAEVVAFDGGHMMFEQSVQIDAVAAAVIDDLATDR